MNNTIVSFESNELRTDELVQHGARKIGFSVFSQDRQLRRLHEVKQNTGAAAMQSKVEGEAVLTPPPPQQQFRKYFTS